MKRPHLRALSPRSLPWPPFGRLPGRRPGHLFRALLISLGGLGTLGACQLLVVEAPPERNAFESDWAEHPDRVWIGRDHWANRLQDWELESGGAVCLEARPAGSGSGPSTS